MFALWSWPASLVAAIIATLAGLYGLLLRSGHVAVLAEAPQIVWHVGAIREDVVHLVRPIAAEYTESTVPFEDRAPDLLPVLRELLTAPGLPTPRQQYAPATTRQ